MELENQYTFCLKKLERLADREFNIEILLQSGKLVESKARVEEVDSSLGPIQNGDFESEELTALLNTGEVDRDKLLEVMWYMADIYWQG